MLRVASETRTAYDLAVRMSYELLRLHFATSLRSRSHCQARRYCLEDLSVPSRSTFAVALHRVRAGPAPIDPRELVAGRRSHRVP